MFKTLVTLAALLMSAASMAHHSGAPYDNERRIEVTGVVVEWQWQNPHAWLRINARDSAGVEQEWNIEATSPNILMRQGWRRSTLEPGDQVTVLIYPLRDGSPGGSLLGARLADGTELGAPPGSSASGPQADSQE
jgi:hypothetical protein